ncbi:MAG: QcrA and Rieske domain-containing protein [Aggregatilineales bacterium]
MATASVSGGKGAAVATKNAAPAAAADAQAKTVTRREFLYYIWGASLALATAEGIGAVIWFALPRFRAGEFGGVFTLAPDALPKAAADMVPVLFASGKFWQSNTDDGFRAMSQVCTHLGCLFKWNQNGTAVHPFPHFVCPCHGSQFTNKGVYVDGPAPRSLDQFAVTVIYNDGTTKTTSGPGEPVSVTNAKAIAVDTGKKITGKAHG